MRLLRPLLTVFAALALVLAGCGDDDSPADPTPEGIGDDDDTPATVPDDDDGAVGEDVEGDGPMDVLDEDSQTNTTTTPPDDLVPEPGDVLVTGDFADGDIRLLLTEDSECAIREAQTAGGESAAEVRGATEDGDRFTLDWSTDAGTLVSEVVLDGESWTADADLDRADDQAVEVTPNGEVLLEAEYSSADGQEIDAVLYVNCRPEATG